MTKKCKIPKCGRPHRGRGLCNKHLLKQQRYGDPLASSPNVRRLVRFLKESSFYRKDECLIWPFSKDLGGYGQCSNYFGIGKGAHRNMCYLVYGPPPTPQYEAAHSCRNRDCVNPMHLSWKTASANRMDKVRDNTHSRGERNTKAKLTEKDVHTIRKLRGTVSGRALAARYGVTPNAICSIYKGKSWAWLA